jgi:hypothetical protein
MVTGSSSGQVMCQNRCHGLAPSMAAGLVEFRTDGLQAGEQADGEERHPAPDVDDDNRDHGEVWIAQPVDPTADQAEMVEEPIENAERRVEHPLPGESREHGRDNEREQDESTGKSLAAEITVEQHGQPQPERQLEDGGYARIDEGVVNGGAKDPVIEDLVEVSEADEVAGHTDARAGDRQQYPSNEGIGNEHAEQHDSRHQQHERQPALVLEHPLSPRRGRLAERGGGNRAYRHVRSSSAGRSRCSPRKMARGRPNLRRRPS